MFAKVKYINYAGTAVHQALKPVLCPLWSLWNTTLMVLPELVIDAGASLQNFSEKLP